MTELIVADVSEFQEGIDHHAYVHGGNPAVNVRIHNGYRADHTGTANRDGFHQAGITAMGLYQYVVHDRDTSAQAHAYCDAIGHLRPGEYPCLDLEEGNGDLSLKAATWRGIVTNRLGIVPWLYADLFFYREHNLSAAGFPSARTWIADWAAQRPSWPANAMWQFTNTYGPMPGINARHDASRFYGSITDLLKTAEPGSTPKPTPPPTRTVPFPGADHFGPGCDNRFILMLGQWLVKKGYSRFYHVGPSTRWGSADQAACRQFQEDQHWNDADGIPGPMTWAALQA